MEAGKQIIEKLEKSKKDLETEKIILEKEISNEENNLKNCKTNEIRDQKERYISTIKCMANDKRIKIDELSSRIKTAMKELEESEEEEKFSSFKFRMVVPDVKKFKKMFKLMSSFNGEIPIHANKDYIHTHFMDPANVSLIFADIHPKEYSSDEFKFIVNSRTLYSAISKAKPNDCIILKKEGTKLTVIIDNEYVISTRELKIHFPYNNPKMPELVLTSKIDIDARICKDAFFCVDFDSMFLSIKEGDFIMSGVNDLEEESRFVMKESDQTKISGDGCVSKYSVYYMKKFFGTDKETPFMDRIKLEFSKDYPLVLTFKDEKDIFGMILAPRVENE